jgi:RNA polymerase sigma-70 factor (ECF subfamily)
VTDRERFQALHAALGEQLLRYFLRRSVDPSDAADLAAETYLTLWRRIDRLPEDEDGARAWAFGVARGVLLNHSRGVRRRLALADRLRDALLQQEEGGTADNRPDLGDALGSLSEDDRELIVLIAWDGLSPAQAAAVLGVEPGAARVRLHRARKRLRAAMSDDDLEVATRQRR